MEKQLKEYNITNYEFIPAVDGKELNSKDNQLSIFQNNSFGNNPAVMGCALSHIKLWQNLLQDTENDQYMIMEDDILFGNEFNSLLENFTQSMNGKFLPNLVFLHYHLQKEVREKLNKMYDRNNSMERIIELLKINNYVGGTGFYLINKTGAKVLLESIFLFGIRVPIDNYITGSKLVLSNIRPFIVFTDWVDSLNSNVDSDIQQKITKSNLNVILRGHIRNSFDDDKLYKLIHNLNKLYNIKLYIQTWNIFSNNISWRSVKQNSNIVNEKTIRSYFRDISISEILILDDKEINLIGNKSGNVCSSLLPIIAWKNMWYGKNTIAKYVNENAEDIPVLNTRFDVLNNSNNFTEEEIFNFIKSKYFSKNIMYIYNSLKCGIDNIYIGNKKNLYILSEYFNSNLDSICTKYPHIANQEFLVPLVSYELGL